MTTKTKRLPARYPARSTVSSRSNRAVMIGVAAVVVIGVIAVIAVILSSIQPPYVPEVTGRPAVQVSQTRFDYGDQHYNNPVTTQFTVKNVGDQTLIILGDPQIEVLEGCCPPRVSTSNRRLAPGQEATVSFTFSMHAGMDGPHHFRVHVQTNDPENADQFVDVYSNWIP